MTKRAVIYARVSTVEQGRGYSLETQSAKCHEYADIRGYIVVREFQDRFSGTELERPGLDDLLQFVANNSIDVVVAYDLDRVAREPAYQAIIEMELEGSGAKVEYVLGQYEDSPSGELTKSLMAAIAKFENRQRVERCRRGKIGRVKAGNVIATGLRAPYGYKYVSEPHKGQFQVIETEAKVVRQIYDWILEGRSCYWIAQKLHEQRELTRGDLYEGVAKKAQLAAWSPSTVRRIVASETYKGIWYYGKTRRKKVGGKIVQQKVDQSEWIAVPVPSIVDDATWERAQKGLAANKTNAKRNTRREYLLRGMVFCRCGRRWTGRYKNHLRRAYYRCPVTEKERWMAMCDMPGGIRQETLEDAVWNEVAAAILNPDNLRSELRRRRENAEARSQEKVARLDKIGDELAEMDRKLGVLLDQALTQGFPETIIQDRKNSLLAKQGELRAEALRIQAEMENSCLTAEEEESLVEFSRKLSVSLEHIDFDMKRRILELLNVRIDVISTKRVKLSAIVPFPADEIDLSGDAAPIRPQSGSIATPLLE